MKFVLLIAFLAMSVSPVDATGRRCVLPVPDGGGVEPSPASLKGRLVQVRPHMVVIRIARNKDVSVRITHQTQLFTAYGGGVDNDELKVGQYASIWLEGCAQPRQLPAAASYLEVCSLAPEPCPGKGPNNSFKPTPHRGVARLPTLR